MGDTDTRTKIQTKVKSSLPLITLIVALLALRWTIVEPYVVPTGSMEPTLKTGDRLYALKCAYDVRFPFTDYILFKIRPVKRGDVILFRAPHQPSVTFVKRALAVEGDKVEIRDGVVFINDKEIPKSLYPNRKLMYDIPYAEDKSLYVEDLTGVKHFTILDNLRPQNRSVPPFTVPSNAVFAVGDNRDNSSDSRVWGLVPIENLKGKAIFIWLSAWDLTNTDPGRDPGSLLWQLIKTVIDFFIFSFHLLTGDSYVRLERIGTLIQ